MPLESSCYWNVFDKLKQGVACDYLLELGMDKVEALEATVRLMSLAQVLEAYEQSLARYLWEALPSVFFFGWPQKHSLLSCYGYGHYQSRLRL